MPNGYACQLQTFLPMKKCQLIIGRFKLFSPLSCQGEIAGTRPNTAFNIKLILKLLKLAWNFQYLRELKFIS